MQNAVQCLLSSLMLETHAICALGATVAAKELPRGMQAAGMQLQKFKLLLEQPPLSGPISHDRDLLV